MKNSLHKVHRRVDFKARQQEFAAYIRDPENNPLPADVKKQRMSMYRELFFNNIEDFLSKSFPVLRNILTDRQWFALARDFYARHSCKTPYFLQIPEEFLEYLKNERECPDDLPFMLELAHYEWVEMAISIAKEDIMVNPESLDSLLEQAVALSPLAWPLVYQYPVQKIGTDFLPLEVPEQPTFLIVYRNKNDDVNFLEITPITYRLLEIIQEHESQLVGDCLKQVAEESDHPDPEFIIGSGLEIVKELAEKTIVIPA